MVILMANFWQRWLASALHVSPQHPRWQRFISKWGELSLATLLVVIITSAGLAIFTPAPTSASGPDNPAFAHLPYMTGPGIVELMVKGNPIMVELDGDAAPITAGNFVDLVDKGIYDGLSFHRVVREPQPFVVQGGDPQGLDPDFPLARLGTGGYVDPTIGDTRYIPLEILFAGASDPVYSSPGNSRPVLLHTRGAVAMARSQAPDSASSQFYITLADQPFLNGKYAVFGYVTSGMDVVDEIEQGDRIDAARVVAGLENLVRP